MRKLLLLAALLLLSSGAMAAPHPRPRHFHRHPHPRRLHLPWQSIVAGGAAVSGIVLAYKVGSGIEQGAAEAAKAAPEGFLERFHSTDVTLHIVCGFIVIGIALFLLKKRNLDNTPFEEKSCCGRVQ